MIKGAPLKGSDEEGLPKADDVTLAIRQTVLRSVGVTPFGVGPDCRHWRISLQTDREEIWWLEIHCWSAVKFRNFGVCPKASSLRNFHYRFTVGTVVPGLFPGGDPVGKVNIYTGL